MMESHNVNPKSMSPTINIKAPRFYALARLFLTEVMVIMS